MVVDLSALIGGADGVADIVTVKGTEQADNIHVKVVGARVVVDGLRTETVVAGAEPIDQLVVDAPGGDDKVTVDPAVSALIGVAVELGPDRTEPKRPPDRGLLTGRSRSHCAPARLARRFVG